MIDHQPRDPDFMPITPREKQLEKTKIELQKRGVLMYPTKPGPFRAWLAYERGRVGVDLEELAERADLPVDLVHGIEVGERQSNAGHRAHLATALYAIEKERALPLATDDGG